VNHIRILGLAGRREWRSTDKDADPRKGPDDEDEIAPRLGPRRYQSRIGARGTENPNGGKGAQETRPEWTRKTPGGEWGNVISLSTITCC
jgi:hypothetical protein